MTKESRPLVSSNLSSLRFRLVAAMLLVFLVAVLAAGVLDRLGAVNAATPDEESYQDGVVLGCFSLAVLVLIWAVSEWSLRPIARASAEARAAGPQHPGQRLTALGLPTELRPLAEAVNGALDRMEAAYEAERRFTSNAAHELRTPLSVLSLRLQRARLDGTPDWEAIDGDMRQMTHLVHRLLDLARKEQAGRDMPPQEINLARIAREAAAMFAPLAERAGRPLDVILPESLPARGRADDLRDMILNLLDNALAHGRGAIALHGSLAAAMCVIEVRDEGPGVPEALRNAVFERFRKVKPSSAGTGLGLAIVREVAENHGGSACFADAAECIVRIEIPEGKNVLF